MSSYLRNPAGATIAWWGKDELLNVTGDGIKSKDIPALIAWLKAGPPKKEWVITRKFEYKPGVVTMYLGPTIDTVNLTDDDMEQVNQMDKEATWERGYDGTILHNGVVLSPDEIYDAIVKLEVEIEELKEDLRGWEEASDEALECRGM
jgi:hypothetical protein